MAKTCPDCNSEMVLRTARKGRNAGGQFWGCSNYPKCKGTLDATEVSANPQTTATASTVRAVDINEEQPSCPVCGGETTKRMARRGKYTGREFWGCVRRTCKGIVNIGEQIPTTEGQHFPAEVISASSVNRAPWNDVFLQRHGWSCRYENVGGSLRALPRSVEDPNILQSCWIARTNESHDVSAEVLAIVSLMTRIIQRGTAPPIDPRIEKNLFDVLDSADSFVGSSLPGDITLTATEVFSLDPQLTAQSLWSGEFDVDLGLTIESEEERSFFIDWLPTVGDNIQRWVLPQAGLESLIGTAGDSSRRRVDFLFNLPATDPFIVEIDGSQHHDSEDVDNDRDAALRQAGYEVFRVPAEQIRRNKGNELDKVKKRIQESSLSSDIGLPEQEQMLVYGPVELHRLVYALMEAVRHGYVSGSDWAIELIGVSSWAKAGLLNYVNLFRALDQIYGFRASPKTIRIRNQGQDTAFELFDDGYRATKTQPIENIDVQINIDKNRSPGETLPDTLNFPQIVLRTAALPIEPEFEGYSGGSNLTANQSDPNVLSSALKEILTAVFGKEQFREGQQEAITELIQGRDSAVLLPTGGGKSLIYQLAALCTAGRALVIDPLVALMEDQIEGLLGHGIDRVTTFSSFQTQSGGMKQALAEVESGYPLFIFVAPERLQQEEFRKSVRALSQLERINLAVIDEAHCVSEWGHDFRTAYLNLGSVVREVCRDRIGNPPPLIALTGTASRAVLKDVLFELNIEIQTPNTIIKPESFDRKELHYKITRVEPKEIEPALTGILRRLPTEFKSTSHEFYASRGDSTSSGIIFSPHVNGEHGVISLAETVNGAVGRISTIYSGGAPRGENNRSWEITKRRNATQFKSNESPLLVSTKAFGMGIDKPNIRYVIHYGLPSSIEGYYQEVGRAGRDQKTAHCELLLIEYDEARARRLLSEDTNLEDVRTRMDEVSRHEADDVTRQMFFHLNAFRGVRQELDGVSAVLTTIGSISKRRTVELSFGEDSQAQERAIHRLVILGVVRDYLVEWGARKFILELNEISRQDLVERYVDYVRRNQPQRAAVEAQKTESIAETDLSKTIIDLTHLLIDFVYETVEKSRRRSLREMWLASRESAQDADKLFRQRILDYLTQGDLSPVLESLVEKERLSLADWTTELDSIIGIEEVRELRGSAARLLASYPDHPGLLLTRGYSELKDPKGDIDEFISDIQDAIRSAKDRYDAPISSLQELGHWLVSKTVNDSNGNMTAVLVALQSLPQISELELKAFTESNVAIEPGLAIFGLTHKLRQTSAEMSTIIKKLGVE